MIKYTIGLLFCCFMFNGLLSSQSSMPQLTSRADAIQLIVDGQAFLIRGGELGNSTATTIENMEAVWPKLTAMNLNTVLIPVFWELVEAEEGVFDFSLYEALIREARQWDLKIIVLWFGSWKNSMSSHAPAWVKTDQQKYPRVKDEAGSAIDFLAPDFYTPEFKHWCDLYTRQGDVLFVPEHRFDETVAAKALYSIAHYGGLGFAPFSIESTKKPEEEPLGKMYALIDNLTPLITAKQEQGKVEGVLLSKQIPQTIIRMGEFELTCKNDYTLSWTPGATTDDWPLGSAIIIQTGDDEFYIAGTGVVVTFQHRDNKKLNIGLLKVDEGTFEEGDWKITRHLNGDQTHQGRHVSIPAGQFKIQRVELYRYE